MATYDPRLLDALESLPETNWQGPVWRHMFGDNPPERPNVAGARWNPPGVGAVYTAFERDTAIAEGQHAVDVQPLRPRVKRVLYQVEVTAAGLIATDGAGCPPRRRAGHRCHR